MGLGGKREGRSERGKVGRKYETRLKWGFEKLQEELGKNEIRRGNTHQLEDEHGMRVSMLGFE